MCLFDVSLVQSGVVTINEHFVFTRSIGQLINWRCRKLFKDLLLARKPVNIGKISRKLTLTRCIRWFSLRQDYMVNVFDIYWGRITIYCIKKVLEKKSNNKIKYRFKMCKLLLKKFHTFSLSCVFFTKTNIKIVVRINTIFA